MLEDDVRKTIDFFYSEVRTLKNVLPDGDDFINAILSLQTSDSIDEVRHIAHAAVINLRDTAEKRGIPEMMLNELVIMVDEIIAMEVELRELEKVGEFKTNPKRILH